VRNSSYNTDFKEMAVRKLLLPGAPTLTEVAREIGISPSTLFGWKQKYVNGSGMKSKKSKSAKNWTAEQKLKAVAETLSLSENELGEYLRKNGLHSSDLQEWKDQFLKSQKGAGRPKKDPEIFQLKKKEKELQRELRRKDKALAEMSARVILLKKSHAIFGVDEDDE